VERLQLVVLTPSNPLGLLEESEDLPIRHLIVLILPVEVVHVFQLAVEARDFFAEVFVGNLNC